ncbi:MAG: helix-turn-helix transcriptional regulator [SAR324 cluster bacterium]|nr:helix-turn-helix transcriptional regulator [SAR324 cluster bacterium]
MEISQEQLAKLLRVSEEFISQWSEGKRIMEHGTIKALEAILEEHRFEKIAALDLQNEMDLFRSQARITEEQLVAMMGLSSINQLYEIYRKKPMHHVLHFILLRRELKGSAKTGKRFRMHMDMVHYEVLPAK